MINQALCLWFSPLSTGAISGQYSGLRSRHLARSARDADGSSLEKKTKRRVCEYSEQARRTTKACRTALVGSLLANQILDCVS